MLPCRLGSELRLRALGHHVPTGRPSGPGWLSKGHVRWDQASPPAPSRAECGAEDSRLSGALGQGVRKRQLRAHSSPESKGSLNFPGASPFTAWFFSFMHRFMLERADAFSPRSPTATAPCSGPPGSPRPTGPGPAPRPGTSHLRKLPWRTEALRLRPGLGARAPSSPNPILVPPGGPRDTLKASATHWSDTEVRPRWAPSCSTITAPTFRPGDELWCSRLEAKAISYHIPENCGDSKLEGDCLGGGCPPLGSGPPPAQQDSGLGNSRAPHAWSWQRL